MIHGDFRLDNMLFGTVGAARPLTVVDWQTVTWGPAFTDVAYFIGCALPVAHHSRAARDWWSMEWGWSALHLDDGTHLHGLDLRIPGAPPMSVGYRQCAGEPGVELRSVTAREEFGDDDLPISTELDLDGGDVMASFETRGHAPVLLRASDGRVSRFPRAWGLGPGAW